MKNKNFAILVLSCDKYADVWPMFLRQFRLHFPYSQYPIYLGSNKISCDDPGVIPILSGEDLNWSTSFKRILEQIEESKIFVILEDLFLTTDVDDSLFQACLSHLHTNNALHIKYWSIPIGLRLSENQLIGIYPKQAPYRATVCGFWDRAYLMSLLLDGESPWDFEILGSYRTSYLEGFYALSRPLCEYRNMIEKGFWLPDSVNWARGEKISLKIHMRPLLSGHKKINSYLQMLYFDLMKHLPWRWRVSLMNKLRRAFISY